MIKIRFFSDFCSSDGAMNTFFNLNELEKDPDYNVKYTFTHDMDYTHAILMNKAMPSLNIPRENVIGIAFEPREFLNITSLFKSYAKRFIGKYFIGDALGLEYPFVERCGYMWHTPLKEKIINKSKTMSMMISEKMSAPGHIYRHELVKRILDSDLDIDIYGRGCERYKCNDKRLKGIFERHNDMLDDYDYHICIENYSSPHYFSEKIMDPLICNTVPIYLGCTKIEEYFKNMIIHLTGNVDMDMALLDKICDADRIIDINIDLVKEKISIKNVIYQFLNA